jgi:hypothetical protein
VITDAVAPAGESPLGNDRADRLTVSTGPVAGTQYDRSPCLGIFEPGLGRSAERDLCRIHDMQDGDLVTSVSKKAERLERECAIQQKVRHEHDQPTPAQLLYDPSQCRLGRGPETRRERRKGLEELFPMAQPGARREHHSDIVVEGDETGRVTLAKEHERERGNEPLRICELWKDCLRRTAPGHGPAGVAHDDGPEVGLFFELLHVQTIVAPQNLPVYVPKIVAGLIHPVLGELYGKPAAGGAMKTGQESLDYSFSGHLDPSQLGDLEGIEQIEPDPAG